MLGAFALHRRSQHAAASADDSASIVAFDLWIALPDEKQARHVTMMENPLEAARFVGELGQPASRDKLLLAKDGPVVIAAGAVGSKEQGESLAGGNTNTRIEMIDTGEVEVISDQEDAKIFQFTGSKLNGRMLFARDGDSKMFNITNESVSNNSSTDSNSTDGSGGTNDGGGEDDSDKETDINDHEIKIVESFIVPELDQVIQSILDTENVADDIAERMRAIRQRLSEKKITKRDICFILRFISGGEAAARQSFEEELAAEEVLLFNSNEFLSAPFTVMSDGYAPFEVVPDGAGKFTIPRLEFIKPGQWGGHDFTFDDSNIGQIQSNFSELSKTEIVDVPTKIGHGKSQKLIGSDGELAHGWVTDVWNEPQDDGLHGFMKITDVPSQLAFYIKNKNLKNRSAEFFKNLEYNGKEYGPVLKAISFLGTTTPAVLGMQTGVHDGAGAELAVDSAVASYSLDGKEVIIANLSRSENQMTDAAKVLQLSQAEFDAKVKAATDQGAKTATEQMKAIFDKDKEDMNKQFLELSAKLKTEQDVRRKETVKAARAQNIVDFDLLVKGGHVLPVQKQEFMNLCNALDGVSDMAKTRDLSDMLEGMSVNKDTLEFSVKIQDADKQVDFTGGLKAMFLKMLRGQKQIALGVQTLDLTRPAGGIGGAGGGNDGAGGKGKSKSDQVLELTAKIQDEKKIPYSDALSLAVKQIHGDKSADAMIDGLSSTDSEGSQE